MSASLKDGIDFDDDGCFDTAGAYLQKPIFGAYRQEIDPYAAAGVEGQGTTNFGYRGQQVTLEVMYVGNDADTVFADAQADNASLGAAIFDATVQGVQLFACKLVDFRTAPEGARSNGLPTPLCYLKATITFDALRLE
jgi:hypothetical protein